MKKKLGYGVLVLMIIMIAGIGVGFYQTIEASKSFSFTSVSLTDIEDGTYVGSASAGMVQVQVQVTIKDHQLMHIEIVQHDQGMGKKAEVLVQHMVNQNTTDVDVVSGATVSSKVLRKAVENALSTRHKLSVHERN